MLFIFVNRSNLGQEIEQHVPEWDTHTMWQQTHCLLSRKRGKKPKILKHKEMYDWYFPISGRFLAMHEITGTKNTIKLYHFNNFLIGLGFFFVYVNISRIEMQYTMFDVLAYHWLINIRLIKINLAILISNLTVKTKTSNKSISNSSVSIEIDENQLNYANQIFDNT